MNPELADEFLREAADCSLACFLGFMRKNAIHSPGNQQDRAQLFLSKALFWRFLDLDCFGRSKRDLSRQATARLLEAGLHELFFLQEALPSLCNADPVAGQWLRSTTLTLLAQLHRFLLQMTPPRLDGPYDLGLEARGTLEGAEAASGRYIRLMNVKQPFREVPEFATADFQRSFFLKFNNDFCQICSIADTLSDADYFIFCEVS